MEAIKFIFTKKGNKKAYIYDIKHVRWFPLPLAEAELLIATEQAYIIEADSLFA